MAVLLAVVWRGEVDVPGWMNIPGVDLPFIGDDALVCDVAVVDADIEIALSGGGDEIDDYRHVWLNGEVVEGSGPANRRFVVPRPQTGDAHMAVSTTPERATRFWCGTIPG